MEIGDRLELLAQGAEARVYISEVGGRPCVVKERFWKGARRPTLDARLTDRRVGLEARMLARARRLGVDAPAVYWVDTTRRRIYMELVVGVTTKQFIQQISPLASFSSPLAAAASVALESLAAGVGRAIAALHDKSITHGDLTTSNLLLRAPGLIDRTTVSQLSPEALLRLFAPSLARITVIDFGLSFGPAVAEDKAVDLYVLERAFISTHPKSEALVCFSFLLSLFLSLSLSLFALCSHFLQVFE